MTRRDDGKTRALAASRTLNPRPEKVTDAAFAPGSFFDPADLVQVSSEMVRRSEIDGVPVATAAAAFGFSRQSLYTAKSVLAGQGLAGLIPARPGPKSGHKLTEEVVDLLEELLAADATLRPGRPGRRAAAADRDQRAPAVRRTCAEPPPRRPGRPPGTTRAGRAQKRLTGGRRGPSRIHRPVSAAARRRGGQRRVAARAGRAGRQGDGRLDGRVGRRGGGTARARRHRRNRPRRPTRPCPPQPRPCPPPRPEEVMPAPRRPACRSCPPAPIRSSRCWPR